VPGEGEELALLVAGKGLRRPRKGPLRDGKDINDLLFDQRVTGEKGPCEGEPLEAGEEKTFCVR